MKAPPEITFAQVVAWKRPLRVTRFLNEACDAATTCASGLSCAVSGNAAEARCVAATAP